MVLVTGASGFLGRHLVRSLSPQGPVKALYYNHPPGKDIADLSNITWIKCDLLDPAALEEVMADVTEVFHCAAVVSFDRHLRDEMLHFNVESTANIVNASLLQGIRKMVYVSSVSALGRTGDKNKEITEEAEWGESKYNSAYGLSKYLAEMEVWRGIGEGLDAVIVNPGIILGPGDHKDLSVRLMKIISREYPFYPIGITSWVGIDDVVNILKMLMQSDVSAERFIISGGNFSYQEIFNYMAAALQKKNPRYRANRFLSGVVWRLNSLKSMLTGKRSVITKESVTNANAHSIYNNQKFLQTFPAFSYTPIQQTIERMAWSFTHPLED